eukprot:TRINITY_DN7166_c0_g1_i1.p1 TRINITY_DN7166_c0_g1~~TRINITY_DN7166_c0_g1_i1.p1  ORF type:complete len:297 (+),score=50.63 TRINITY_DN7166_c0_g1_i1:81-893(+)
MKRGDNSRKLKFSRSSHRTYYRPSIPLSSSFNNELFKKNYATQRKLLNEFDVERTRRSVRSRQSKRVALDRSVVKKLDKELQEMKRASSSHCTYITSYQINKELEKAKLSPADRKEEANVECIRNIVALHMKRLNIVPRCMKTPAPNSRNTLDYRWTTSTSNKKPRSTERFTGFFRKPKRHYRCTNFEVKKDRTGKWCNRIERSCIEQLDENEDVDCLLKRTEEMFSRMYKRWEGELKKVKGLVYAPRVVVLGNRKNDVRSSIAHNFDIL